MPHLHRDREAIAGITLRDAARTLFVKFFLVSAYGAIFGGAFGRDVDAATRCIKGGLCLAHCWTGWECKRRGFIVAVPAEGGVEVSGCGEMGFGFEKVRW